MSDCKLQWRLYRCEFKQDIPIVLVKYLKSCQSVAEACAVFPNLIWHQRENGSFATEPELMISQSTSFEYYSIEQR